MAQVTKSDYLAIQKNMDPFDRQDFVRAIDFEDAAEFIQEANYYSTQLKEEFYLTGIGSDFTYNKTMEQTAPHSLFPMLLRLKFRLTGEKSEIKIYPAAFDFSYEKFLSTAIDHEGHHARQSQLNPLGYELIVNSTLFSTSLDETSYFKTLIEVAPIANELRNSRKRNLDEYSRFELVDELRDYLENLENLQVRIKGQPDYKKDLKRIACFRPLDEFLNSFIENRNQEQWT